MAETSSVTTFIEVPDEFATTKAEESIGTSSGIIRLRIVK
jgi:hypothetical protein